MNKIILGFVLLTSAFLLVGCDSEEVVTTPEVIAEDVVEDVIEDVVEDVIEDYSSYTRLELTWSSNAEIEEGFNQFEVEYLFETAPSEIIIVIGELTFQGTIYDVDYDSDGIFNWTNIIAESEFTEQYWVNSWLAEEIHLYYKY